MTRLVMVPGVAITLLFSRHSPLDRAHIRVTLSGGPSPTYVSRFLVIVMGLLPAVSAPDPWATHGIALP